MPGFQDTAPNLPKPTLLSAMLMGTREPRRVEAKEHRAWRRDHQSERSHRGQYGGSCSRPL